MLWNVATGEPLWKQPARHASKVIKFAFNSTGNKIASISDDNTAAIWSKDTGEALIPAIRIGASGVEVAFNTTGDILFTQTPGGTARIWDTQTGEPVTPPIRSRKNWEDHLAPDSRPTEDLIQLGQVLASIRLTESGGISAFDTHERRKVWQALKAKYPADFGVESARVKTWHDVQARVNEDAGQWFAAGWHLDQRLERNPSDVDLRQRRANAAAKMNDWARAANDANLAIMARATNAEAWYQRGLARGHLGDWDAAAMDMAKAVELKSNSHASVGLAAKVALLAKDEAAFRQAVKDEYNLYKDGPDATDTLAMVWVCLLHKDTAGINPAELLAKVDKVPATADAATKVMVTLAHLRAGKAADAVAVLKPLSESVEDRPVAWACLALAQKAQGDMTDARKWGDKARDWLKAKRTGTPTRWDTVAETTILLNELGQ
jgi:tetratricopeptide (TPR) repeat protein